MPDPLPYYCHQCVTTVEINDYFECLECGSSFVEIYEENEHPNYNMYIDSFESIRQLTEELDSVPQPGTNFFSAFEERLRSLLNSGRNSSSSIASDRRNYAIGPELDNIIAFLLETEGRNTSLQPANEDFIKKIEIVQSKSSGECSICLTKYCKNDWGIYFKCGHFFHQECAYGWMKVHNTCPNCRSKVDN